MDSGRGCSTVPVPFVALDRLRQAHLAVTASMWPPCGATASLCEPEPCALLDPHPTLFNSCAAPATIPAAASSADSSGSGDQVSRFGCGVPISATEQVTGTVDGACLRQEGRERGASASDLQRCAAEAPREVLVAALLALHEAHDVFAAEVACASRRKILALDAAENARSNSGRGALPNASFCSVASSSAADHLHGSIVINNKLQITEDEIGMKVVNQYTLLKDLGRGSFGKVKLAAGAGDELVAIKVIAHAQVRARALSGGSSGGSGGGEETLAAVEREVALMAKLRHKNVLRLREVINDPDARHMYLVMNYAERGPLLALRANGTCTALDFDVARGYMKQLLSGLHYLHARRVWHRDIKPSNILLGGDGVVYFADFGVSSYFDAVDDGGGGGGGGGQQQQLRDAAGTPAFHAPEVWSGEAYLGGPADVWALGVTFYAMVYGRLPFRGATSAELRRAVCEGELEFPELEVAPPFSPCQSIVATPLQSPRLMSSSNQNNNLFSSNGAGGRHSRDSAFGLSAVDTERRCSMELPSPTRSPGGGGGSVGASIELMPPLAAVSPTAAIGGFGGDRTRDVSCLSSSVGANDQWTDEGAAARDLEVQELQELLRQMLAKDHRDRPTASRCRRHPFIRGFGGASSNNNNKTRIARVMRESVSLNALADLQSSTTVSPPALSLQHIQPCSASDLPAASTPTGAHWTPP